MKKNPLLTDVVDSQVEEAIKVWLRNAGDRNGGRKERSHRLQAETQAQPNVSVKYVFNSTCWRMMLEICG